MGEDREAWSRTNTLILTIFAAEVAAEVGNAKKSAVEARSVVMTGSTFQPASAEPPEAARKDLRDPQIASKQTSK